MSDRKSLLKAIYENPHDDNLWLVYADWLEENGEPEYAEFIRIDCELEPVRDRLDLDRVSRLAKRAEELANFEKQQLQEMAKKFRTEKTQQKKCEDLFGDRRFDIRRSTRRGVPLCFEATAADFLEHAENIRSYFPPARKLRLYCVNGYAEQLVNCPQLEGIPELEFACWYTPEQAKILSESKHFEQLEVLTLWLGGWYYEPDSLAIPESDLVELFAASAGVRKVRPTRSHGWPNLRELRLYNVGGGSEEKTLVELANETAGRSIATFHTPASMDGKIPLAASFAYFCPGKLPDGRRMAARPIGGQIHVIVFGEDDHVGEEYDLPIPAGVEIDDDLYGGPGEDREAIHKIVGSTPAFIRVFPFRWPDEEYGLCEGTEYHYETWKSFGCIDNPDSFRDSRYGCGGDVSWIAEGGQYGCEDGWCDKWGDVHST